MLGNFFAVFMKANMAGLGTLALYVLSRFIGGIEAPPIEAVNTAVSEILSGLVAFIAPWITTALSKANKPSA